MNLISYKELNNDPRRCWVCHRPLPKRQGAGRGRKKEVHRRCGIVASRLHEMESLLRGMQFGDQEAIKVLRGNLFSIVNVALRPDRVVLNPDSEEEI